MNAMTPTEIVQELDKYIIGQKDAKKSVAIALRNRYRRNRLPKEVQEEISPKNIIMIGPTGVGKTEIVRRLAKLVQAPYIKVEATKFTEVGYVGRDVESMIRDLVEVAIRLVNSQKIEVVEQQANQLAEERLLDLLVPMPKKKSAMSNPLEMFFPITKEENETSNNQEELAHIKDKREITKQKLKRLELEQDLVEIEVADTTGMNNMLAGMGVDDSAGNLGEMFDSFMPKKMKKRKVTIEQARKILIQQESEKLIDFEDVKQQAIHLAENTGIIFLDEIDKIANKGNTSGQDVSREGVQRDILPIVEGSIVKTKYGNVKTDHMLFIAAGAFHVAKPTDLIPELQGRFPIRVYLEDLTKHDLERILREPNNSLLKQYTQLLEVDNIRLTIEDDAISQIAQMAFDLNVQTENIGARRLHTMLEKLLEDVMYSATEMQEEEFIVTAQYVTEKLGSLVMEQDLSKFVL